MEYQVNLGFFEGPLDLLFHLVKKDKLEINNISLSEVTEQYLAYIRKMQELDLDFVGDFLVTASQLMELKSRTLLPSFQSKEDSEKNEPHELITRLMEYKRFKELATKLKEKEGDGDLYYTRNNEELVEEIVSDLPEFNPLENVTLNDFRQAFMKALTEASLRENEKVETDEEEKELQIAKITIKDKMLELESVIEEIEEGITFNQMFSVDSSRIELVITFLALLELMKLKKVKVSQNDKYEEIMIKRTD
ncbi:MAG: segregation/condensation protein A [Halanaerobiales bacterium]|nr:segregation/condensation protein A [Halanaerobiales bacterium]